MAPLLLALLLALPGPRRAPARGAAAGVPAASATPAADPSAGLSDEAVRGQVQAFLGSIDTPIREAQWKALGPRATGLLEQLAGDRESLPSRRAKAVDGLAGVGGARAPALLGALAEGEAEPLVVRLSAVRGLGRLVPSKRLAERLRPLLEGAGDSRVRAVAAEVLAARSRAHCALVSAQLQREAAEVREQFHRSTASCAPAAGTPAQ